MVTFSANLTGPDIETLVASLSDGVPSPSRMSTILYSSLRLMTGGLPLRDVMSAILPSSSVSYASDLRAKRSDVLLTGANLERGTQMAVASVKHSMAAPMAVSSWKTGVDFLSLGSMVLVFLIIGRGRLPPCSWRTCLMASSLIQRLFVLKNWWVSVFWKFSRSSCGH